MIKRILRVSILLLIVWGIFKNPVEESIAHEQSIEETRIKREERRELQRTRKDNIIEEMLEEIRHQKNLLTAYWREFNEKSF